MAKTKKLTEHEFVKREAAQWARNVLKGNFVILDTETTGLDRTDSIVSIGVLRVERGEGIVLIDTLINPECPIPKNATRIHGIDDAMVATAPTIRDMISPLREALSAEHWVIYNRKFDVPMLQRVLFRNRLRGISAALHGLDDTNAMIDCAMEQYARFWGDYSNYHGDHKWQSLSAALYQLGLPVKDAHHAIGDCWSTLAVIKGMAAY